METPKHNKFATSESTSWYKIIKKNKEIKYAGILGPDPRHSA